MITHDAVWAALDDVADKLGKTRSGMTVAAGLDATTFSKCRESLNGVPHYPTLKSVAAVLNMAGMTMTEFGQMVDKKGSK